MKSLHHPEDIIAQRYRILNQLGQGGVGITYQALDLNTNEKVALKVLSLRRMTDWKKMELFEREAQILSQLNHPAIPHYLDYFQVDTATDQSFYIAQQLASGKSLAELVENGWRPDENEVKRITIKILEIIVYLQSLTPPVIHRDIKPQNIILNSDGKVFLVDFGAVQDTYHNTVTGGSTIVGTFGYMAPEQFRGQAVLSTDLYGLGTTILFLLTGKSPADLPSRKLKINFRSQVQVSHQFANWLEKMLAPVIEERFPSAAAALAVLQGQEPLSNYARQKRDKPENSRIILREIEDKLIVKITPQARLNKSDEKTAIFFVIWNCLLFCLLYLSVDIWDRLGNRILGLWTLPLTLPGCSPITVSFILILVGIWWRSNPRIISTIGAVFWDILTLIIFSYTWLLLEVTWHDIVHWDDYFDMSHYMSIDYLKPIQLGFAGACLIELIDLFVVFWKQRSFLLSLSKNIQLEITPKYFQIRSSSMNQNCKTLENSTQLIKPILSFLGLPMNEQPITDPFLQDKLLDYRFHSLLNQAEKEWLASEIKAYLDKDIFTLTSLENQSANFTSLTRANNHSIAVEKSEDNSILKINFAKLLPRKYSRLITALLLIWNCCLFIVNIGVFVGDENNLRIEYFLNWFDSFGAFSFVYFLLCLLIRSSSITVPLLSLIGNILLMGIIIMKNMINPIYFGILLIDTFVVLWIQRAFIRSIFAKVQLQINSKGFEIEWRRHGWYEEKFAGSIKNLPEYLHLIGLPVNRKPLKIRDRIKHLYKNRLFLDKSEKEWLAKEISDFLQKVKK